MDFTDTDTHAIKKTRVRVENIEISNEMKQKLLSELELIFPNQINYKIDNFQKLHGVDAETFGFRFITE